MDNPLVRKLEQFKRLLADDKRCLDDITASNVKVIDQRHDLIREGDKPRNVFVILEGWACRYRTLNTGRRQILAFLTPGDLCDMSAFILKEMDHSIGTLTRVRYAETTPEALSAVTSDRPRVVQALLWETLVNAAIQREWNVSLGQRNALERMGHLLCELHFRLRAVGLTTGTTCEVPLTQIDIADATGLSIVHANRTIQELRASGLISFRGKFLTIPDLEALMAKSLFSPNYLHLDRWEGSAN